MTPNDARDDASGPGRPASGARRRADPGSRRPAADPGRKSGSGRPIHIGLTGPIGCGKSTVAGWLGELGARVIDADQVARDVTPPGSRALAAIEQEFGPGFLRANGELDRAALGRVVFADAHALHRLERILHPAVRPRILDLLTQADESSAPAVVIEAIKLVEGGLAELCDEVWLITCDRTAQRVRLVARATGAARSAGTASPDDAAIAADTEARIAAQGDLVARLTPHATRIIDTSGTIAESRSRVVAAFKAAVGEAREGP